MLSLLAVKRLSAALREELISQLTKDAHSAPGGGGNGNGNGGGGGRGGAAGKGASRSGSAASSVLVVNSTSMGLRFPVAFERLDVLFYRCGADLDEA